MKRVVILIVVLVAGWLILPRDETERVRREANAETERILEAISGRGE